MVLYEWYREHKGRANTPVILYADTAKKKFKSTRTFAQHKVGFSWENWLKELETKLQVALAAATKYNWE